MNLKLIPSSLIVLFALGCGSSEETPSGNGPISTPASAEEQQAAQAKLGAAAGTTPGKEDAPTAAAPPNSPGNEMPADTSK